MKHYILNLINIYALTYICIVCVTFQFNRKYRFIGNDSGWQDTSK